VWRKCDPIGNYWARIFSVRGENKAHADMPTTKSDAAVGSGTTTWPYKAKLKGFSFESLLPNVMEPWYLPGVDVSSAILKI
jgi:hypothetical protein